MREIHKTSMIGRHGSNTAMGYYHTNVFTGMPHMEEAAAEQIQCEANTVAEMWRNFMPNAVDSLEIL